MAAWERKYSDEERTALEEAYLDRGIRPVKRIKALAEAGELPYNGAQLPAFTVPLSTIYDLGRTAKQRRSGVIHSELADGDPDDAIEVIRKRLLSVADHETKRLVKAAKRDKTPANAKELQGWARALREAAAIPARHQQRLPIQPGLPARDGTREKESATVGTLARDILKADQSAPKLSKHRPQPVYRAGSSNAPTDTPTSPNDHNPSPGSWLRDEINRLSNA